MAQHLHFLNGITHTSTRPLHNPCSKTTCTTDTQLFTSLHACQHKPPNKNLFQEQPSLVPTSAMPPPQTQVCMPGRVTGMPRPSSHVTRQSMLSTADARLTHQRCWVTFHTSTGHKPDSGTTTTNSNNTAAAINRPALNHSAHNSSSKTRSCYTSPSPLQPTAERSTASAATSCIGLALPH